MYCMTSLFPRFQYCFFQVLVRCLCWIYACRPNLNCFQSTECFLRTVFDSKAIYLEMKTTKSSLKCSTTVLFSSCSALCKGLHIAMAVGSPRVKDSSRAGRAAVTASHLSVGTAECFLQTPWDNHKNALQNWLRCAGEHQWGDFMLCCRRSCAQGWISAVVHRST